MISFELPKPVVSEFVLFWTCCFDIAQPFISWQEQGPRIHEEAHLVMVWLRQLGEAQGNSEKERAERGGGRRTPLMLWGHGRRWALQRTRGAAVRDFWAKEWHDLSQDWLPLHGGEQEDCLQWPRPRCWWPEAGWGQWKKRLGSQCAWKEDQTVFAGWSHVRWELKRGA